MGKRVKAKNLPTIHCAYDKLVELSKLIPHPKNRNKHPSEQVEELAEILEYQGIRKPITVSNRSGYITAGHGRLLAFKLKGWSHAPVDFQDYDTEEQERADVTADNAIAAWAGLDLSAINTDILELGPELKIRMLGIKGFELEPADKKAKTKRACPNCGYIKEG